MALEDSYVDLTAAQSYFQGRLYADAWDKADELTQIKALKSATRAVDRLPFGGRKKDLLQARAFPRLGQPFVPTEVKHAVCEEALTLLERGNSERRRLQLEGVVSFKIGKTSESFQAGQQGQAVKPPTLLSQEARDLLKPFVSSVVRMR